MVGFVREHISEHGSAGAPSGHPAIAIKLCYAAIRRGGKRVLQHEQTLRGTFAVRGGGLTHGAAVRI